MNAEEKKDDGFIDHSAAYEAQHEAWHSDASDGAKDKQSDAERITNHPMYSASDLAYLRKKGYSDAEILAFWDRDHAAGEKPVYHAKGTEALRDNLSPQAVAVIVQVLRQRVDSDRHDSSQWKATIAQVRWFNEQLVEALGGEDGYRVALNDIE